jgi:hypothetical protein
LTDFLGGHVTEALRSRDLPNEDAFVSRVDEVHRRARWCLQIDPDARSHVTRLISRGRGRENVVPVERRASRDDRCSPGTRNEIDHGALEGRVTAATKNDGDPMPLRYSGGRLGERATFLGEQAK